MIELICDYPTNLVMGTASLAGAIGYAIYSIHLKKKELKDKFKFDYKKIIDTIWQSTLIGVTACATMACGYTGIIMAILCGIGIDKVTNKLQVKKYQILNFVQMAEKVIDKLNSM